MISKSAVGRAIAVCRRRHHLRETIRYQSAHGEIRRLARVASHLFAVPRHVAYLLRQGDWAKGHGTAG